MAALFATEPARPEVIDEIISDPGLFTGIQRRIEAMERQSVRPQASGFRARRLVAYAGMGLAGCLALTATIISNLEKEQLAGKPSVETRPAAALPTSSRSENPPQPNIVESSEDRVEREAPRAEKAVLVSRPKRRVEPEKVHTPTERFLPVSYTGDPSETAGGGQIIRVEMKRSSLFAMGVDMPLENDDPIVKAELLVGRDGVTRGVRLVD